MYQRCDNAYDVKQHFTANGPEKEFARDARAQIRGVMDPLSVLEHRAMVGNRLAFPELKRPSFKYCKQINYSVMTPLGLGPSVLACRLFEPS